MNALMNEYVVWGGPIVTRAVALADCREQGISDKGIDVLVFGRQAVPAPADPEAHVAMLAHIRATFG